MSTKYASNSFKSREAKNEDTNSTTEKKKINKVVKCGVKTKKKSEISKIAGNIVAEECGNIKDYILYEVIVPVLKDTVVQVITGATDMFFYGEVRSRSSSKRSGGTKVSYRDYYDDKRDDRRDDRRANLSRFNYDDIVFDSRSDAEEVLSTMEDIIDQYGAVSVYDLYDLVGISSTNGYTDQNYGWKTLRNASVERTRHGDYIIRLPRPTNIR